jgi:hypothetical protein
MIALVVGLVVILVVAVMLGLYWSAGTGAAAVDPRVAVDLHAIRRRRDLAEFKTAVRRDVLRAQRELRAELEGERGRDVR